MENEEIKYLDYQIIAIGINVLVVISSIIIIYNQELDLKNKKTIMTSETQQTLTYITKLIILALTFIFLYINYKLYDIAKQKNKDTRPFELQILAGMLIVISALITTYVVFTYNNKEADIENPEI